MYYINSPQKANLSYLSNESILHLIHLFDYIAHVPQNKLVFNHRATPSHFASYSRLRPDASQCFIHFKLNNHCKI